MVGIDNQGIVFDGESSLPVTSFSVVDDQRELSKGAHFGEQFPMVLLFRRQVPPMVSNDLGYFRIC